MLIVLAAMTVPWLRMTALIDAGQLDLSRQMALTWERIGEDVESGANSPTPLQLLLPSGGELEERAGILARRVTAADVTAMARADAFIGRAFKALRDDPAISDYQEAKWSGGSREYRYARAIRAKSGGKPELAGLIILERRSYEATRTLALNSAFLLGAGFVVLVCALSVFYVITRKLVLNPVKALERTAESVRSGSLAVRAEINTGDEFQQLAGALNQMLNDLQSSQDRLRSINAALDLKIHELAEANNALFQAAKVKGEFVANVSHELRTPLNSIIGFAELLLETARADAEQPDAPPSVAKRIRYLGNIVTAGRDLLSMINSLLEMAKIEAGKVDLNVERVIVREVCEGLLGLIFPLAEKKQIRLRLDVADDVPPIRTDVKKFQQIIFNFLSNAVKFSDTPERTGREPEVVLRAEKLVDSSPGPDGSPPESRVRVSVIDNGPGIDPDDQKRIFEKFYQADGTHTRGHAGTGLGLAISKELAHILHAEIQVISELGRGSMFSLILPLEISEDRAPEAGLEARFRTVLSGSRDW